MVVKQSNEYNINNIFRNIPENKGLHPLLANTPIGPLPLFIGLNDPNDDDDDY